MPGHQDSYDKARALVEDSDPNISEIARTLFHRMVLSQDTPAGGFNFLYFVQAAIRLWFLQHPGLARQGTTFLYRREPINGINWPDDRPSDAGRRGMVERFVEMVKVDSIPSGVDFDVAYAATIIALAFDCDGTLRNPPDLTELKDAEFDYWLSGFNNDQS